MSTSDELVASLSPLALEAVLKMKSAGINTELMKLGAGYCCRMSRSPHIDPAIGFAQTLDHAVARTADIARERWPELFASET